MATSECGSDPIEHVRFSDDGQIVATLSDRYVLSKVADGVTHTQIENVGYKPISTTSSITARTGRSFPVTPMIGPNLYTNETQYLYLPRDESVIDFATGRVVWKLDNAAISEIKAKSEEGLEIFITKSEAILVARVGLLDPFSDDQLFCWNLRTGERIDPLFAPMTALSINSEGDTILVAEKSRLLLIDLLSSKVIRETSLESVLHDVFDERNGKWLLKIEEHGVGVWDENKRSDALRTIELSEVADLEDGKFTPDGCHIIVGGYGGSYLLDSESLAIRSQFRGKIDVGANENFLIGRNGGLWPTGTVSLANALSSPFRHCDVIDQTGDGKRLLIERSGELSLWEPETLTQIVQFDGAWRSGRFSPNGDYLFTSVDTKDPFGDNRITPDDGDESFRLGIHDAASGKLLSIVSESTPRYSADESNLIGWVPFEIPEIANLQGILNQLRSGESTLNDEEERSHRIALGAPTSTTVHAVFASKTGKFFLHNIEIHTGSTLTGIDGHPDTGKMAFAFSDGSIFTWTSLNGLVQLGPGSIRLGLNINQIKFSPNGDHLALVSTLADHHHSATIVESNEGSIVHRTESSDSDFLHVGGLPENWSRTFLESRITQGLAKFPNQFRPSAETIQPQSGLRFPFFSPRGNWFLTTRGIFPIPGSSTGPHDEVRYGHEIVRFSPDEGRLLLHRDNSNRTELFNFNPNKMITSHSQHGGYRGGGFSQSGALYWQQEFSGLKWRMVPVSPTGDCPPWYADFLELMAERRLVTGDEIAHISFDDWIQLRESLEETLRNDSSQFARFASWFLEPDPLERLDHPLAVEPMKQAADRMLTPIASKTEIERAYELDPTNPLIPFALSNYEEDQKEIEYLQKLGQKRLAVAKPSQEVKDRARGFQLAKVRKAASEFSSRPFLFQSWIDLALSTIEGPNEIRTIGESLERFVADYHNLHSPTKVSFFMRGPLMRRILSEGDRSKVLIKPNARWSFSVSPETSKEWTSREFDDSKWESGRAPVGYGHTAAQLGNIDNSIEILRKRAEIGQDLDAQHRFMYKAALYGRYHFWVDDATTIRRPVIALQQDDGAIIYLNGQELFRVGMPSGKIDHDTNAIQTISGLSEEMALHYEFDPSLLIDGINLIGIEVHQASPKSSDLFFDLALFEHNLLAEKEFPAHEAIGRFMNLCGFDPATALYAEARLVGALRSQGEGLTLLEKACAETRPHLWFLWTCAQWLEEEGRGSDAAARYREILKTARESSDPIMSAVHDGAQGKIWTLKSEEEKRKVLLESVYKRQLIHNKDNGHYYQRLNSPMPWSEAKAACEILGGYLASATSKEENDFLYEHFAKNHACWLGAFRESVDSPWQWITGEPFDYTNWHSSQPSHVSPSGKAELRIAFGQGPNYGFQSTWNDQDDSAEVAGFDVIFPICEWKSESVLPEIQTN